MNSLASVEMRWFFREPPFDVSDYFDLEHQATPRVDWYAMPSDHGCGIKIREGRLEAKLQVADLGERQIANVVGRLDTWKKWSSLLPTDDVPSKEILDATNWIAVSKVRSIRRFEIQGDEFSEVKVPPENGCSFELTSLEVNGESWSTVGFEAIGQADQTESHLEKAIALVQRKKKFSEAFAAENSMNYVVWLNRLHVGSLRAG